MRLILGGARSGKSRFAEQSIMAQVQEPSNLYYVATAAAGDKEMQARITQHQQDRGPSWHTREVSTALAATLSGIGDTNNQVLVDCLTLWISNCLHAGCWPQERDLLLQEIDRQLAQGRSPNWTFVSNEVGSGIVPLGQLSRDFVDASGWLHQALAERCQQVTLVVAGLPLSLKGEL
ncbi:bifunctional adenosylcobinamide kinase/adenosylcobinamide-phosphate guanylyltransferase [Gilvimarinus agarilyticus]|uniref:bifunctional adenosylcobinamide kinase/adenosylcobinamide-phosphate guanylyltransferase n=1 Tax=Gilvimarinus sp. 2_MG-2023 TaxID=3062666 RepID=UPI001C0A0E32|nr:bifunctional adenosylcobinamide kinase/adenosylcobinamide-phosphate guanylyltransferase [Gilvimarinus sp. 2_MG-2023]MBU2886864.1 bifunctional adenosylcobinamide kinase/adenosylcobinamide-phosphate guanylyltransferase [Gilvimarinus agarilyticus]MDO6571525.1 bifunctional adenosylcobinamide kinase/adenosylcobinamide-phosphate guanylyltransferase [Gilvimarinus sp. 2_MG-2023]